MYVNQSTDRRNHAMQMCSIGRRLGCSELSRTCTTGHGLRVTSRGSAPCTLASNVKISVMARGKEPAIYIDPVVVIIVKTDTLAEKCGAVWWAATRNSTQTVSIRLRRLSALTGHPDIQCMCSLAYPCVHCARSEEDPMQRVMDNARHSAWIVSRFEGGHA